MTNSVLKPLVSVTVITYNSAKTVLDTLESIKAQTYQNIELIISDDCSTDDTVEICKEWIDINQSRFIRSLFIESRENTGIPANLNRAESNAQGEFVKEIAGDDYLDKDYLKIMVDYLEKNNIDAAFSNSIIYYSENNLFIKEDISSYREGNIFDDIFWLRYWPKAPSWIFRRSVLAEIGYNDESIWVEDYLKVLKIAQSHKIGWVNEYLTYYRIHSRNSGKQSIKLLEAHLATINRFPEYKGYKRRKREVLGNLFSIAEYENPAYLMKNYEYNKHLLYTMFMCIKKMCQYNFPKSRQIYKRLKQKFYK